MNSELYHQLQAITTISAQFLTTQLHKNKNYLHAYLYVKILFVYLKFIVNYLYLMNNVKKFILKALSTNWI
jgi:hypothetical protein